MICVRAGLYWNYMTPTGMRGVWRMYSRRHAPSPLEGHAIDEKASSFVSHKYEIKWRINTKESVSKISRYFAYDDFHKISFRYWWKRSVLPSDSKGIILPIGCEVYAGIQKPVFLVLRIGSDAIDINSGRWEAWPSRNFIISQWNTDAIIDGDFINIILIIVVKV